MHHERRILKSVLTFLVLVGVLFGLLSLLPVMAQTRRYGRAAPDEFLAPVSNDGPVEILGTSATGHIVDDKDPDPYFKMTISPDGWAGPYGGGWDGQHYRESVANTPGDSAEWHPDLPDGDYEVSVYWRASSNRRTDAQYTVILHGVTDTLYVVNQQLKADGTVPVATEDSGWYALGVHTFRSGAVAEDFVRLTDGSLGGSGTWVVADAVKFSPMEVWVDPSYCIWCPNDGRVWDVTAFDTIQGGVDAVATGGAVHVNAGTYNEDVVLDKRIEVTGAGASSTTIQPTGATTIAVAVLTDSVAISGFTIEEAGSGALYGIANFDVASGVTVTNLTNYLISSSTIKDFGQYGIYLKQCSGEISGSRVQDNKWRGIWLEGAPTVAPIGPSILSDNTLSSNGDGSSSEDAEIRVEDMYTGTVISGNTVGGNDSSSDDVGIHVVNESGDATLSGNHISGCHWGVQILQVSGTDIVQKVNLINNTIRNGHTGIRVWRSGGTWTDRQIVIGGSVASSNSIYGNSNLELRLAGYSDDIDASYNDWGAYNLRAIEDEIRHGYDASGLGLVTYEPALGVPYTVSVEASPSSLPADGMSAAMITATVEDVGGYSVRDGMIGITTSLGTVPYGYAEAEDTSVVTRTVVGWVEESYGRASGGKVMRAAAAGRQIGWTFTGEAVSLIYMKSATSPGSAQVYVDDVLKKTIDMTSTEDEHRLEETIATGLGPGTHSIMVQPDGSGRIWVDAFRSGGVSDSRGRVFGTITSNWTGSALVWGTVYDGRIITDSSAALYPILTDTAQVDFEAVDVYVVKDASATAINTGQQVTFTINYGNYGVVDASGVVVTDTLPTGLVDVSTEPAYDSKINVPPTGVEFVWNIGTVEASGTGAITIVARPDPTVLVTVPVLLSNAADIASAVTETALANNSDYADVTVLPPANLTITAYPPEIPVSNGEATSVLTVTVTDSGGYPVDGVTVALTTTEGSFAATGLMTHTVTTTMGVATTELASTTAIATATVTATVMPAGAPSGSVLVRFIAAPPAIIESEAYPTTIPVCGAEAVITATIKDQFGHLVPDGTSVTFNVVIGAKGEMYPRLTTTLNGVATSTVRTKGYYFGDRFLQVYILAQRMLVQTDQYQRVDLVEGPPAQVDFTLDPPTIEVDGDKCEIDALVMDCGGNPVVDGTAVTFSVDSLGTISPTTTTTTDGIAETDFWSKCGAGASVVTATVDSLAFATTVPIDPGPADIIFVDIAPTTIQNCGGTAVVTATVYDVCLNKVKDNTPVLFTPQYGYVNVLPALGWTQDGVATAIVTAVDEPLETWPMTYEQIDVTSGAAVPGFSSMSIVPGDPSIVTVMTDKDSIRLDGDVNFYDITVVARVGDCSDTPVVDGTSVMLRTDLGFFRESGTRTVVDTTVTGLVTATLTSQTEAGLVTLTANADSAVGAKVVRFLPDPPFYIEVWGAPPTIRADGEARSYVTAHLMDQYYNTVLDGVTVTFVTDWGQFMGTYDVEYITFTDADGLAYATLIATDVPHNALVRAIAYNEDLASDVQGYTYVLMVDPWKVYMPMVYKQGIWP